MINLHSIIYNSTVNGPGRRIVIWFQGCSLKCPGCFNSDMQSPEPQLQIKADDLIQQIVSHKNDIEGITISGGEPFDQPDGLCHLVNGVRSSTHLSILVFSGYMLEEITRKPMGREILSNIDVLIDGRYDASLRLARGLRGSSNQSIHLLTSRYTLADIESTPECEVCIAPDGSVTISGIDPPH